MKKAHILSLILITIVVAATVPLLVSYTQSSSGEKSPVYVGVAFGGTTVAQAKTLIDRTKGYTNLFILDSGINPLSSNESAVKEVCDYAVNAGLNIIVNLGTWNKTDWDWKIQFLNDSKQVYGEKFLGAYYDDEPAGIPLDWDWETYWTTNSSLFSGANPLTLIPIHYKLQMAQITGIEPQNYTLEAQWFNELVRLNHGHVSLDENNIRTFTSDYALYWFDYTAGYDVLFAQLGWNQSVNQQISELRGAATLQNKDWGAIITWKYMQAPYLDTGANVYDQMVTAYNSGAKYITIFDYPYNNTGNPYGVLNDDHFQALEKFWTQVATKSSPTSPHAEAALVLPNEYGWGMRSPDDRIWGFWGPDSKSPLIWNNTQTLLSRYGLKLDIVYEDPAFPVQGNYSKVYYWNQTIT